jgi:hypothetical protein
VESDDQGNAKAGGHPHDLDPPWTEVSMDQLDPMLLNESTQCGIVPGKQEVELAKSRCETCFKSEIWKIVQRGAIDTPAPRQYRPVTP